MKIAKVIPIFKTGSSQDMTNYRPISTLTSFSKILEKIVHKRLYDFLDANQILYDNQFGFRRNHSTALAVIETIDRISESMDSHKQTLGVFLDLSKAFDSIRHDILLDKLSHYGIRGLPLEWFRSFLTNRFQFVSYAGSISDLLPILCGVPQGSILGPLLFLIYINDVSHSSKTLNFILFADDTSAFLSSSRVLHLFQDMTLELNHLSNWFCANFLLLNIKKSNYVLFSGPRTTNTDLNIQPLLINSVELKRVSNVKFLGVILDEHLTWHDHILMIKNKVSKVVGIINSLKWKLPTGILRNLYNSFILPYLTYCTTVWAGVSSNRLKPIFLLQKRLVRIIAGVHYLAHSSPLFKSLNLLSIYDIYRHQLATLMYRHQLGLLPSIFKNFFATNSDFHHYNTRKKQDYRSAISRIGARSSSVRIMGPKLWNSIDPSIRSALSLSSFKYAFKSFLVSQYS